MKAMAIGVVERSKGGYKIGKKVHKSQHTKKEIIVVSCQKLDIISENKVI